MLKSNLPHTRKKPHRNASLILNKGLIGSYMSQDDQIRRLYLYANPAPSRKKLETQGYLVWLSTSVTYLTLDALLPFKLDLFSNESLLLFKLTRAFFTQPYYLEQR